MDTGTLASSVRGQDFEEGSKKAAALDEIAKFNATNKQKVNLTNVGARNLAQEKNLSEKQRLADTNTAASYANRVRNADLIQKQFENKMALAAGKSGQYGKMAESEDEEAKRKQAYNAALIGAGGQILAGS